MTERDIFNSAIRNTGINTFSILSKNDEPLLGLYTGIVIDNRDPEKLGRCRIQVQCVFDGISPEDLPWANPRMFYVGSEMGNYIVPPINSKVHVEFENGDIYSPLYSTKVLSKESRQKSAVTANLENPQDIQVLFETDQGDFLSIDTDGMFKGMLTLRHNSGSSISINQTGQIYIMTNNTEDGKITIEAERNVDIFSKGNINIKSDSHTTVVASTLSLISEKGPVAIEGDVAINGNLHVSPDKDFFGKHVHIGNSAAPTSSPVANNAISPASWNEAEAELTVEELERTEPAEANIEYTSEKTNVTGDEAALKTTEKLRTDISRETRKYQALNLMMQSRFHTFTMQMDNSDKSSLIQILNKPYPQYIADVSASKNKLTSLIEEYEADSEFPIYMNEDIPSFPLYILKLKDSPYIKPDGKKLNRYEFISSKNYKETLDPSKMILIKPLISYSSTNVLLLKFKTYDDATHYLVQEILPAPDQSKSVIEFDNEKLAGEAFGRILMSKAISYSDSESIDKYAETSLI